MGSRARPFHETVRTTSMIMLIIIFASIFSHVIALLGTPRALLGLVTSLNLAPWMVFAMIFGVLILILLVVILFLIPDLALWLPRQMMTGPR